MLKLKLQYFGHWGEELTHWKRPWCWERLKAGGKGDDRGWDGWMASLTQWTWVWANSGDDEELGGLVWCGSWGCSQSDMTERLNNNVICPHFFPSWLSYLSPLSLWLTPSSSYSSTHFIFHTSAWRYTELSSLTFCKSLPKYHLIKGSSWLNHNNVAFPFHSFSISYHILFFFVAPIKINMYY